MQRTAIGMSVGMVWPLVADTGMAFRYSAVFCGDNCPNRNFPIARYPRVTAIDFTSLPVVTNQERFKSIDAFFRRDRDISNAGGNGLPGTDPNGLSVSCRDRTQLLFRTLRAPCLS